MKYDGFFIGWAKTLPKGLSLFLTVVSALIIGLFAGTAFSIVTTQNDPGDGGGTGRVKVMGVLFNTPYPHVRVLPDSAKLAGQTVMLSGGGKFGVQKKTSKFEGAAVELQGVLFKRGTLDMLQLQGKIKTVRARISEDFLKTTKLGRWRLTGELCDSKCYSGAMRPGTGIAHKACANLCILGGIPPVFVSTGKVEGSEFFMLADQNGNPIPAELLNNTAVLMEIEGEIEKRGNLMVFKVDPATMKVL